MAIGYDFAPFGTSHLWTLEAMKVDSLITALVVGVSGGMTGFVLGRGIPERRPVDGDAE